MEIAKHTYPNRMQISKVAQSARQMRMVLEVCLGNLDPDETMHYELGEILSGPNLGNRIRLFCFLQMTLPGQPIRVDFDAFVTTDFEHDPDSLKSLADHLEVFRRNGSALQDGDYYSLSLSHPDVFGFVRQTEFQRFVVMVNCTDQEVIVKTPALTGAWVAGTELVTGTGEVPRGQIDLGRYEGKLFETRRVMA